MGDLIVVFDTVVFVRALINPHSFWGRLVFEYSHEYRLFLTPQTMREYVEVLQRPELTRKFSALRGIDVARIPEILQHAEVVMPREEPQVSRDVKDNKFLAAAEAAKADYLVSEDRDLLDLIEYKGTCIVREHEIPGSTFIKDKLRRINPMERMRSRLLNDHHPYGLLLMSSPLIAASAGIPQRRFKAISKLRHSEYRWSKINSHVYCPYYSSDYRHTNLSRYF